MTRLGGRPPAPLVRFEEWSKRGRWWPTSVRQPGPAAAVVVHHTVTVTSRFPAQDAQRVENVIWDRRWTARFSSLPYSYLLHPDGTILEGRGVKFRNAANRATRPDVKLSNGNTLSVALIGDYREGRDAVTPAQRRSFNWLTRQLSNENHLGHWRSVVAHGALSYTECPAEALAGLQQTNIITDVEDHKDMLHTVVSTTNGKVWACSNGKARPISNTENWLATFDGPIIRADFAEHVVPDLYDVIA